MGFSQLSLSSILPRLQSLLRGERKQEKYPTIYCPQFINPLIYIKIAIYGPCLTKGLRRRQESLILVGCRRLSSFVVVVTTPEWLTIGIDAFVVAVWRRPVVFVVSR